MRVSKISPAARFPLLLASALLGALGVLLLTDQPGLQVEYFAGPIDLQSRPVYTDIGMPQLDSREDVAGILVSQEIFDLRWRGWLSVDKPGEYQFSLEADEFAYLQLGPRRLAETTRSAKSAQSEPIELQRGVHPVEVGFSQRRGRARLELRWGEVGEEPVVLAGSELVAHRPAGVRAFLLRRSGRKGSGSMLRVLGLLAALGGLILLRLGLRRLPPAIARTISSIRKWASHPGNRRRLRFLFLLALFLVSFTLVLPYTASTADGDDVRYMDGARFNKQMGWNMNRYAHIYALKAFIWGAGGDAFQASRVYWAFMFGMTVLALAVAVRSLGPGLQLGSLTVALLLWLAQPYVFGGIGAAYADYSAMMFVALGMAVYLHGYGHQSAGRSKWHALALGVLSVAAAKSKEPGLIMLWLVPGLLWSGGRLDIGLFRRRMAWWVMGAVGAYLVLMTLDGLILGDFWFSLRLESVAGAQRLKDAAEGIWQLPRWAWLDVAWTRGSLRHLSILAVAGAVVALVRRWSPELRWVALMPLAFMAMMIAIHPAISSPRYLFPIVPVACFVGAAMFHDLQFGGTSRTAVRWVRSTAMAIALWVFFGAGLLDTWGALERHRTAQRGAWTLYPWQVFRQEIEDARPKADRDLATPLSHLSDDGESQDPRPDRAAVLSTPASTTARAPGPQPVGGAGCDQPQRSSTMARDST